ANPPARPLTVSVRVQPRRRNRTAEADRALRLLVSRAWLGSTGSNQAPAKPLLLLIFIFFFSVGGATPKSV
ncbi:hypothetical protein, partial [Stenotrophomonas beteli]|uniref:hypothetical protein n=1 Tax=Stenotrophomonas beteli TaxID=3384461 RepID=UPI00193A836E